MGFTLVCKLCRNINHINLVSNYLRKTGSACKYTNSCKHKSAWTEKPGTTWPDVVAIHGVIHRMLQGEKVLPARSSNYTLLPCSTWNKH